MMMFSDDNDGDDGSEEEEEIAVDGMKDDLYIFRPGTIPPHRQMFYQVAT